MAYSQRLTGITVAALLLGCGPQNNGPTFGSSKGDTTESGPIDETESDSQESGEQEGGTEVGDGDGDPGDGDGDSGDGDGDPGDGDPGDGDPGDGDGEPAADYCDQVDFLFVIDNSISMAPEQNALSDAFPGFIQAIEATLDTDDHVLVTDTDLIGWCTPGNCANPMNLHHTCMGPQGYACQMELEECDITLGAGVVEPAGQGASNMFCDPLGGNRYMLEGEPDKGAMFDCLAHVGLAGSPDERPLDAIVEALSEDLNDQDGCNEGFLRDDAILVVTFISDDDENNETHTPQQVYDAVVAAKNGDVDRIVVLGLTPGPDNNCSFTPGAGEHWVEFIDMFGDLGFHGPSCDPDYVQFFQETIDTIVEVCENNPDPQ